MLSLRETIPLKAALGLGVAVAIGIVAIVVFFCAT